MKNTIFENIFSIIFIMIGTGFLISLIVFNDIFDYLNKYDIVGGEPFDLIFLMFPITGIIFIVIGLVCMYIC